MAALPDLAPLIVQALRRQPDLSSAELQTQLGASQATVSRALAKLTAAGQVRKVGAARSQRYLLPRTVPGVGSAVQIMQVDATGQVSLFAQLVPMAGGGYWVDEVGGPGARHAGLPWFLEDMRPQGFMGRAFAQAHPELQLGSDPRHWSDEDVLRALTQFGEDLPGNLLLGESTYQRFHSLPERTLGVPSAESYPLLAEQAMQGTLPGSSAGGEQPKFCTVTAGRSVLVKFSAAGQTQADQRTRDLLVCEHLALQTLAQAGLSAARTALFSFQGRVFLEVERFDRTPLKASGRIGMVSLLVFDAQYVGQMDNWAATATRLAARQLLTPADANTLVLLEAFGLLIANTDRHYGNISLLQQGKRWALSPVYDMLPMLYAPVAGELVPRSFAAQALQPTTATLAQWPRARELAQKFWQTAANDERLSAEFAATAQANALHVAGL